MRFWRQSSQQSSYRRFSEAPDKPSVVRVSQLRPSRQDVDNARADEPCFVDAVVEVHHTPSEDTRATRDRVAPVTHFHVTAHSIVPKPDAEDEELVFTEDVPLRSAQHRNRARQQQPGSPQPLSTKAEVIVRGLRHGVLHELRIQAVGSDGRISESVCIRILAVLPEPRSQSKSTIPETPLSAPSTEQPPELQHPEEDPERSHPPPEIAIATAAAADEDQAGRLVPQPVQQDSSQPMDGSEAPEMNPEEATPSRHDQIPSKGQAVGSGGSHCPEFATHMWGMAEPLKAQAAALGDGVARVHMEPPERILGESTSPEEFFDPDDVEEEERIAEHTEKRTDEGNPWQEDGEGEADAGTEGDDKAGGSGRCIEPEAMKNIRGEEGAKESTNVYFQKDAGETTAAGRPADGGATDAQIIDGGAEAQKDAEEPSSVGAKVDDHGDNSDEKTSRLKASQEEHEGILQSEVPERAADQQSKNEKSTTQEEKQEDGDRAVAPAPSASQAPPQVEPQVCLADKKEGASIQPETAEQQQGHPHEAASPVTKCSTVLQSACLAPASLPEAFEGSPGNSPVPGLGREVSTASISFSPAARRRIRKGFVDILGFHVRAAQVPMDWKVESIERMVCEVQQMCGEVSALTAQGALRLALASDLDMKVAMEKCTRIAAWRKEFNMDKERQAAATKLAGGTASGTQSGKASLVEFASQREVYRSLLVVSPCALVTAENEPLSIWHFGTANANAASSISSDCVSAWSRSFFEYIDLWLTTCSESSRTLLGHIHVFDLSGVGFSHVSSSALKDKLVCAMGNGEYYVEIVNHIYVVNAGTVFTMAWKAVKRLVPERTSAKITVTRGVPEELKGCLLPASAARLMKLLERGGQGGAEVQRPNSYSMGFGDPIVA